MSFIEFDKEQLINLEYALSREYIRSNKTGTFASSTIIGCNTRKYHGLLICPMRDLDGGNHVLLSALDETLIQEKHEFHLAIHKYPGSFFPKGHKYIKDFEYSPIPTLIYRVGGIHLRKEILPAEDEERIMIRYTMHEAGSPVLVRFRPFLAFRNVHALSKANLYVNSKFYTVDNGIRLKLYEGYKYLYMQFSKKCEYVPAPDWYYNMELPEEQRRGYEFHEDLYVPGYFEVLMKQGESIVFSAGLKETAPKTLKRKFSALEEKQESVDTYEECLKDAARQFFVNKGRKVEIIAGFPWFGRWGRDTFIALPGLTLALNDIKTCKAVLDSMAGELKDGLFPNIGSGYSAAYNSVDAPLWFIWALQQYTTACGSENKVWKEFGNKIKKILEAYRDGTGFNIRMIDNGLIYAASHGVALTWMDAVVNGKPVTPRTGCQVEINALWYNAIRFALELATESGDQKFVSAWSDLPARVEKSFIESFCDSKKLYLADYVDGNYKDWSVRPNQIFATSLPFSPLPENVKKKILDVVESELLTPKGLRSLAPKNPSYSGVCDGDQTTRDLAYHQGTVWPWLLGHFAEGYLRVYGKSGIAFVEKLFFGFENEMKKHGIGTISEIYDGDPPHKPNGTISQAWNVAELLRMKKLVEFYKSMKMLEPKF